MYSVSEVQYVSCLVIRVWKQVLLPHLEPLSEQQRLELGNLTQSCQQAEEALSQGMERLHQILGEAIAKQLGEGNYLPQVGAAIEKLDDLVRFVGQVMCRTSFLCSNAIKKSMSRRA